MQSAGQQKSPQQNDVRFGDEGLLSELFYDLEGSQPL